MSKRLGYNGTVAFVLALLAAVGNAFATVMQRLGVEESADERARGQTLMASVLHRPIWFAGLGLTTASFLFQALALARGNLSTVQPIMVAEIVFLVAILGVGFHRTLGWREWVGSGGTAGGLGAFLALSASSGGNDRPSREDWAFLLIASIGAIVLATVGSQRGPRAWRAACLGVAAAICFALTAACIKVVTVQWSGVGWHLLVYPEAYGIALAGGAGFVITQHALDAGPIAASQSALLIVNPLASIAMGIWLFNDHIQHGGWRTVVECFALAVMFFALFVLSSSPLIASSPRGEQLSRPATM
ncbi:MAG TPA: DMT family transporter [Acidimicrobiales bacterium]|nr:DMT family transporter [Acidimicrobiales bacterium]